MLNIHLSCHPLPLSPEWACMFDAMYWCFAPRAVVSRGCVLWKWVTWGWCMFRKETRSCVRSAHLLPFAVCALCVFVFGRLYFLIGCSKCGRGTLCLSTRCVVCVVCRLSPKRAFPLLSRCRVCDALLARSPFSSYPASSYPRTHSLSSTSFSLLQVLVC